MDNEEFKLGDLAVVHGHDDIVRLRKPMASGMVTAVSNNSVRLLIDKKFLFVRYKAEKWFPINNHYQHTEKAEKNWN